MAALEAQGWSVWWDPAITPGPARVAICVLPFANLSVDPEQQAFCESISADIITELSRWRSLAVRSRSPCSSARACSSNCAYCSGLLPARGMAEKLMPAV